MTMDRRHRKRINGFTVIECLAVALIMLALMAAIMPAFLSAMTDSQRSKCRKNMIVIANAEREYKLKNYPTHNYADTIAHLQNMVSLNVICPTTGTYSLSSSDSFVSNFTVSCSVAEHNAGYGSEPAGYTPNQNTQ